MMGYDFLKTVVVILFTGASPNPSEGGGLNTRNSFTVTALALLITAMILLFTEPLL
jgi:hypothetical protein